MAGGVALNCVANGKLLKSGLFAWTKSGCSRLPATRAALSERRWRSGTSIWSDARVPDTRNSMHGAYLGPEHTSSGGAIERRLTAGFGATYRRHVGMPM